MNPIIGYDIGEHTDHVRQIGSIFVYENKILQETTVGIPTGAPGLILSWPVKVLLGCACAPP